jgi:glycosidase
MEHENSGFVAGRRPVAVTPIGRRLPLHELVIYELMLDDFTAEYRGGRAPLDAVLDKIDYLVELGINAIEFMPWTSWPESEFSWGYNPVSFFSVEYNYYNDDAQPLVKLSRLKVLISELHKRGIHVIMDGVFNHADAGANPNKGFAYFWLYQDPEDSPFIGAFADGGFFNEFDFGNNCTDEFIMDICTYWITEYGIDGIRFDYVKGFYVPSDPTQGIGEIILYLKKFTHDAGLENISFTLEQLPDNRYEAINDTNQIDADGCWFDPLLWEGINTAGSGTISPGFMRALNAGKDFKPGKDPVIYLENHDHSTLTESCGGRQQWWVTQPLAIALFTICGTPFIHNGQEFGEQYWFPEDGAGRVMRRPLRWGKSTDSTGMSLRSLYGKLIQIRKDNPVLTGPDFYPGAPDVSAGRFNAQGYGASNERGLIIYHRWGDSPHGQLQRYIIALNFSGWDQSLTLPFSENGAWINLLDGNRLEVENYACENYLLNSYWGAIYKRLE